MYNYFVINYYVIVFVFCGFNLMIPPLNMEHLFCLHQPRWELKQIPCLMMLRTEVIVVSLSHLKLLSLVRSNQAEWGSWSWVTRWT